MCQHDLDFSATDFCLPVLLLLRKFKAPFCILKLLLLSKYCTRKSITKRCRKHRYVITLSHYSRATAAAAATTLLGSCMRGSMSFRVLKSFILTKAFHRSSNNKTILRTSIITRTKPMNQNHKTKNQVSRKNRFLCSPYPPKSG